MRRVLLAALVLTTRLLVAQTSARIGDLTRREGDIPRRLVGYGLVVGLDGTGDRNYGSLDNETPTVRSIVNLLLHFGVRVPDYDLAPRNAAVVMVTGEVSPYLHAGGRFEVQVSSLSDATSLKGGVLYITPLVSDPNQPPVATAQGPLMVTMDENGHTGYVSYRRGNSGRIPDGGVLEVDGPPVKPGATPRLVLRQPDLELAAHITAAINAAYGPGTASLDDPGSLTLKVPQGHTDSVYAFLAGIDTLSVTETFPARIVINGRDGTVVTGGDIRVGAASISHHGLTLKIGPPAATPASTPTPPQPADSLGPLPVLPPTVLTMNTGATVEDVAAGLHVAGATTQEIAEIFDALRAVHALAAEVVVR